MMNDCRRSCVAINRGARSQVPVMCLEVSCLDAGGVEGQRPRPTFSRFECGVGPMSPSEPRPDPQRLGKVRVECLSACHLLLAHQRNSSLRHRQIVLLAYYLLSTITCEHSPLITIKATHPLHHRHYGCIGEPGHAMTAARPDSHIDCYSLLQIHTSVTPI